MARMDRSIELASKIFTSALFIVIWIVVLVGITFVSQRGAVDTVTGTVERLYVEEYHSQDTFYVVVALDNGETETFQNKNAFWWGKSNTDDVQEGLVVGMRYTFKVCGWRIHDLSGYRNIVAVYIPDVALPWLLNEEYLPLPSPTHFVLAYTINLPWLPLAPLRPYNSG